MKMIYAAIADGFKRTYRRIDLLVILYLFMSAEYGLDYVGSVTNRHAWVNVFIFCLMLLSLSYSFSIPYFFSHKEKKQDYAHVWAVVLDNAKRLLLPMFGLLVIFFVALLGLVSVFAAMEMDTSSMIQLMSQSFSNMVRVFHPSAMIFRVFVVMLTFTPIYFSVKRMSLFTAIKESFNFAYQHMSIVVLLYGFQTLLTFIFSQSMSWPLLGAMLTIAQVYIGYFVMSGVYSYYLAASKG